jgi:hypothetical protein
MRNFMFILALGVHICAMPGYAIPYPDALASYKGCTVTCRVNQELLVPLSEVFSGSAYRSGAAGFCLVWK